MTSAGETPRKLPLEGIRVVDVGQLVAGPMVAMLLGDFGAEVIKVEPPNRGDPYRTFTASKNDVPLGWKVLGRNKKSITLNLRDPRGVEIFRRLIRDSDVLVESFRPATLSRWGIGYEALNQINPRLVMVMVSGFGMTGPYRDRPGFGTLVEAMSGFAHMTGNPAGAPTLPSFPLADSVAALYGVYGVMLALYERDVLDGRKGQCIDLSLLEPLFTILGPLTTLYDQLGVIPKRTGNRTTSSAPRNAYEARDGRWVVISGSVDAMARNTFAAIGREDLIDDPRFSSNQSRVANVEVLDEIISAWFRERDADAALEILLRHEVPAAAVMDIAQLIGDPHIKVRQAITSVEDSELGVIRMQNVLPKLSRTQGRIRATGPQLGAHNAEIFSELLGLDSDALAELCSDGVI